MTEKNSPQDPLLGKLADSGAATLSENELMALLLQNENKSPSNEWSSFFLKSAGKKSEALSYEELAALPGLSGKQAAALAACLEVGRRLFAESGDCRPKLDRPERVWAELPDSVRRGRKEHFVAFYLDSRNRLLLYETVSVGTLSASLVHPREVFSPAISAHAAALIVAHNHPSGDSNPSGEDKETTGRLARSGELLGIPLLDHLIVTKNGFFSFKEHGLLA